MVHAYMQQYMKDVSISSNMLGMGGISSQLKKIFVLARQKH